MMLYIFEFALIHSLFLLVYKVLLSGETQLNFRRFFLIGATLLSLVIPLINIPTPTPITTINLAEIFVPANNLLAPLQYTEVSNSIPWYLWVVVITGLFFLFKFFKGLIKIGNWYRQSEASKLFDMPIRKTEGLQNSFTFLRWIFIDPNHSQNDEAIVRHEWGHSRHLHSLDVLFFNILIVPFWWMPSIWLALRETKKVHEYQADQYALKSTETQSYIKTLVHNTMNRHGMNLASSFDDIPIVKRLKFMKMMKRKINPWKMGSIVAIMAITGLVFACENEQSIEIADPNNDIIELEDVNEADYSNQVQLELRKLMDENPNEEYVVYISRDNQMKVVKFAEYESSLIKHYLVNDDGTMSVIMLKEGEKINGFTEVPLTEEEINNIPWTEVEMDSSDEVFNIVEEQPQFPGGIAEFYNSSERISSIRKKLVRLE